MQVELPSQIPEAVALVGSPANLVAHLDAVVKLRGALHVTSTLAMNAMTLSANGVSTIEIVAEEVLRAETALGMAKAALLMLTAMQYPTAGSA